MRIDKVITRIINGLLQIINEYVEKYTGIYMFYFQYFKKINYNIILKVSDTNK